MCQSMNLSKSIQQFWVAAPAFAPAYRCFYWNPASGSRWKRLDQNGNPVWSVVHSTRLAARKLMCSKVPRWRGSSVQHEVYMRGKTQGHTHLLGCQQLPLGSLFGSKISACTVLMGFCLLFQFPFFCADSIYRCELHWMVICTEDQNQSHVCCRMVSSAAIFALQLTATGAATISAGTDHSCWITSDSATWFKKHQSASSNMIKHNHSTATLCSLRQLHSFNVFQCDWL